MKNKLKCVKGTKVGYCTSTKSEVCRCDLFRFEWRKKGTNEQKGSHIDKWTNGATYERTKKQTNKQMCLTKTFKTRFIYFFIIFLKIKQTVKITKLNISMFSNIKNIQRKKYIAGQTSDWILRNSAGAACIQWDF